MVVLGVACQEPSPPPTADATTLKEGDRAPDFTLWSPQEDVSLSEYRGSKPILLYFSMGPG